MKSIAFIRQCKRSTEFHFDGFEEQMRKVRLSLKKNEDGDVILKEGINYGKATTHVIVIKSVVLL